MDFLNNVFFNLQNLVNITAKDVLDIMIVAYAIYRLLMIIKETRAEQLIKGIFAIFVMAKLSEWFKLHTINWILENALTLGVLALLIVFQPELRRVLEYIGRSNLLKKSLIDIKKEESKKIVNEIVDATLSLSRQKIGALIVFENQTGLSEILETGTKIDALISSELLINIFIPNTPLHDGAVIIKGEKIKAASCFLPLTDDKSLSKELGTRHRAAIGITEKSDCLSLIVSEETGKISVARNGKIKRYMDEQSLKEVLTALYITSEPSIFTSFIKSSESELDKDEE